jgi:hypothetical protein
MSTHRTLRRVQFARAPRILPAPLLLALSAVLAPGPLGSTAGATSPPTCAQLKGKHLRSGGRAVVVTQLLNKEQTESRVERVAYVCASPNGRAWRAGAEISMETENPPKITVVTGAGGWVALRYEGVIGNGFSESESAVNSATGKSFRYWKAGGGEGSYFGPSLEAVVLNAHGQLALITGVEGKPQDEGEPGPTVTRRVVGVEANGKRRVLAAAPTASIPTSSLKLVGSTVRWSVDGVAHSATLLAPAGRLSRTIDLAGRYF